MREITRKRVRIGLLIAVFLAFPVMFGHYLYLIAHRPRTMDQASGFVEVLNDHGTVYFITVGEARVHQGLFAIICALILAIAWIDFSEWYRRAVPKIKGL